LNHHKTHLPRIFVAGSNGFIGSILCKYLSSQGYFVYGADQYNTVKEKAFWCLDLVKVEEISQLLKQCSPDYIFHVTGLVGSEDENALNHAHVETTRALLLATYAASPLAKILVLGSAAEYGCNHDGSPIREGSATYPDSPYGRSKLAQSKLALQLSRELQLDVIRVRLFNSMGPGQGPMLVAGAMVKRLYKSLIEKTEFFDVYDPFSVRDFLDVRDIVRLLWFVARDLEKNCEREPIHIATGEGVSIVDLARRLFEIAEIGNRLKLKLIPSPMSTHLVGEPTTLIKKCGTGQIKRISIFESLKDMWQWEVSQQNENS